jgi:hypothetical protein
LIVGGYAVAFHGRPRTTGDLDVWVNTAADNVQRVRQVLVAFGYPSEQIDSAPLEVRGTVIRMGRPPLRIELLTGISGVSFEECYPRRESQTIDGLEVAYISRNDLLTNKRAAGRAQDLADLEALS